MSGADEWDAVTQRVPELLAHDRWRNDELDEHRRRRLEQVRTYAYERSAFYHDYHRGLSARPLTELPVLTKDLLMERFDSVVTDPELRLADLEAHVAAEPGALFRGRWHVCATGGTTGRRGLFVFDRDEWTAVVAGCLRPSLFSAAPPTEPPAPPPEQPEQPVPPATPSIVGIASSSPAHMSFQVSASVHLPGVPTAHLDAALPLPRLAREVERLRPTRLTGYPSVLGELAAETLAGRLDIAPTAVFTSSEVLTGATRERIEEAWGTAPYDLYVATEVGALAAECGAHRGLHLLDDEMVCEIVDDDGAPVPPGATGSRVLVTALSGRSLPLIRYELTDRLHVGEAPCPCGRPFRLVTAVEGRADDTLRLPAATGAGVDLPVHPIAFHRVLDHAPIGAWQVVGDADGLHLLVAGLPAGADRVDELVAALRRSLDDAGVGPLAILVDPVAELPRDASGKARLVRSA